MKLNDSNNEAPKKNVLKWGLAVQPEDPSSPFFTVAVAAVKPMKKKWKQVNGDAARIIRFGLN